MQCQYHSAIKWHLRFSDWVRIFRTFTVQTNTSSNHNRFVERWWHLPSNSVNNNSWRAPDLCLCVCVERYLTNEKQIIFKATCRKASPISWTSCCSVFPDVASNWTTIILEGVQNLLGFNSSMRWDSYKCVSRPVWGVLIQTFCTLHQVCQGLFSLSVLFPLIWTSEPGFKSADGLHLQRFIKKVSGS